VRRDIMNIEPFGYFCALPFGWDSCGKNDEGAIPLYEQKTIDDLLQWIEYWRENYFNVCDDLR
jgi:hypothetical protein